MRNRKLKIILDTNIWISFLITYDFKRLDKFIEKGRIELLFSQELLEEFIEVAQRPKFQKYFTIDQIELLVEFFDYFGKMIEVESNIKECRDIKDNFLLNLAVDGKADYLVTSGNDLLSMEHIQEVKIIKIQQLLEIIK